MCKTKDLKAYTLISKLEIIPISMKYWNKSAPNTNELSFTDWQRIYIKVKLTILNTVSQNPLQSKQPEILSGQQMINNIMFC